MIALPLLSSEAGAGPPMAGSSGAKARYIMIGGFLGAGKTTSVGQLAQRLTSEGLRVGLITNDQGSRLVDTRTLRARGFPVKEIPGGCFCCRFNSLVEAAQALSADSRPEVFIAEPVGSCTDLAATVSYPLRKLYGSRFTLAPLSVVVDPVRAMRVLGLAAGGRFSEKVRYIYCKQLEEADLIVVNKRELLTPEQSTDLRGALASRFPAARILEVSARLGTGLDDWFDCITSADQVPRAIMEVDYEAYAQGEARLGWLNCTLRLCAQPAIDGNRWVADLAAHIQRQLGGAEIAHLKLTLDADSALSDLAVVNVVRNDYVPELSQQLQSAVENGELTINLRAEAEPELLRNVVVRAVDESRPSGALAVEWEHLECFQPAKPEPIHRLGGCFQRSQ